MRFVGRTTNQVNGGGVREVVTLLRRMGLLARLYCRRMGLLARLCNRVHLIYRLSVGPGDPTY
jgi:hypothetical protein